MNHKLLRVYLHRRGLTEGQAARLLGMNQARFGAKLHGKRGLEFTLGQLQGLRAILRLNTREVNALFFDEELS